MTEAETALIALGPRLTWTPGPLIRAAYFLQGKPTRTTPAVSQPEQWETAIEKSEAVFYVYELNTTPDQNGNVSVYATNMSELQSQQNRAWPSRSKPRDYPTVAAAKAACDYHATAGTWPPGEAPDKPACARTVFRHKKQRGTAREQRRTGAER